MRRIEKIQTKWKNIINDKYGYKKTKILIKEIGEELSQLEPNDLSNLEDHERFLDILYNYRKETISQIDLIGARFPDFLKSTLSVGENGIYSDKRWFLYELIQNVDDCIYEDDNCNLDIHFSYCGDKGKMVFEYNEKGFTPQNVFSITEIAGSSKNINANKTNLEIGEKGIGFKSVFGIANKVHIESGFFSFEINSDNMVVPVPSYDDFEYVSGTRLTLYMAPEECRNIYDKICKGYKKNNSVLSKNPIIFLNKIDRFCIRNDYDDYIKFTIEHGQRSYLDTFIEGQQIIFENNINYILEISNINFKKEEKCYRYTLPITYGKEECLSRYDNDNITVKHHNLVIVFPESAYESGLMYSFFPTQIKLSVPVYMHVPYKLNNSREYVDSQGKNRWFKYTNKCLKKFICAAYVDFSRIKKQDILPYIPTENLFKDINESVECLLKEKIDSSFICKEDIFYTTDNTFKSCKDVVAFDHKEKLKNPVEVYSLLNLDKPLFYPSKKVNMSKYGIEIIKQPLKNLYIKCYYSDEFIEDRVSCLKQEGDTNCLKIYNEIDSLCQTERGLKAFSCWDEISKSILQFFKENIKNNPFHVFDSFESESKLDYEYFKILREHDVDNKLCSYLISTEYRLIHLDTENHNFVYPSKEGLVVCGDKPLDSVAQFIKSICGDKNEVIVSLFKIKSIIQYLDRLGDNVDQRFFLKKLREVRVTEKSIMGSKYNRYIELINESRSDKATFLNEIIQNTDDCKYNCEIPTLKVKRFSDNIYSFKYNEVGFTNMDLKAITDIGESNKNKLLEENQIGEKGVGFKSIFDVADEVEIHSNLVHFKINSKEPTIPEIIETDNICNGTELRVKFKEDVDPEKLLLIDEDKLADISLGLRNMKRMEYLENIVIIDDNDNQRVLKINEKEIHFKIAKYNIARKELSSLEYKLKNHRKIKRDYRVAFYLPEKGDYKKQYYMYAGLPTSISMTVPLIIDAPFELTTSREQIIENEWNESIKKYIYEFLLNFINTENKRFERLELLNIDGLKKTHRIEIFDNDFLNLNCDDTEKFIEYIVENFKYPLIAEKGKSILSRISEYKTGTIIPDFILKCKNDINLKEELSDNLIVDTTGFNKHLDFLTEWLNCEEISSEKIGSFIKDHCDYLTNKTNVRKCMFEFLSGKYKKIFNSLDYSFLKELRIFPIKTDEDAEFTCLDKAIYISDEYSSCEDFYILDEDKLERNLFDKIREWNGFDGEKINVLSDYELKGMYEAKINKIIVSYIDDEDKNKKLLAYFKNDKENMEKIKDFLIGKCAEIPLKTKTNEYCKENIFIQSRKNDFDFEGYLINSLLVNEDNRAFAEFLNVKPLEEELLDKHIKENLKKYSEKNNGYISDEDIEDLIDTENGLKYRNIIIDFLNKNGYISKEQKEKYDIQDMHNNDSSLNNENIGDENDFPEIYLTEDEADRIEEKLNNQYPIQFEPDLSVKWVTKDSDFDLAKKRYLEGMYKAGDEKSYCQRCTKAKENKNTEKVSIEWEPKYAWKETNLNLCMECSKIFKGFKRNEHNRKEFHNNIMCQDPMKKGMFSIGLDDKTEIKITAKHLLEIQAIFKRQGWGEDAPKREKKRQRYIDLIDEKLIEGNEDF